MNAMTNAERLAADNQARIDAGEDVFGDDEPLTTEDEFDGAGETVDAAAADSAPDNDDNSEPTYTAPDAASAAAEGNGAQQGEPDAASAAAADKLPEEPQDTPAVPAGPGAGELATKLDKLLDSKAEVEIKWAAGEIDDSERARQLREIDKQAMAVNRQLAKAEAEEMREAEAAAAAIKEVKAQAIAQGIDYDKHPAAAKQFDMAMTMLEADPDNAKLTVHQLTQKAHASVLALNGIQPASKAANPATTAGQAKGKPQIPPTLRGLPAASVQSAGNSLVEEMSRLKGAAYQQAFNKLSPAKQAELLGE